MPASNSEARKRLEEQTGWRYLIHHDGHRRGPFLNEAAARQHHLHQRDPRSWTVAKSTICHECGNWIDNHDPRCPTLTGGE